MTADTEESSLLLVAKLLLRVTRNEHIAVCLLLLLRSDMCWRLLFVLLMVSCRYIGVFGFCSLSCTPSGVQRGLQRRLQTVEHLIDPSYDIAFSLGLLTSSSVLYSSKSRDKPLSLGTFRTLIFAFLFGYVTNKTNNVRMKFTDETFSMVRSDGSSLGQHPLWSSRPWLVEKADYVYDMNKINSYSYLPSEGSPLFLYIKESELPPSEVIQPPFIIRGEEDPTMQVHIFPMIGKQRQIEERFSNGGVRKIDISKSLGIQPNIELFVKGLQLI